MRRAGSSPFGSAHRHRPRLGCGSMVGHKTEAISRRYAIVDTGAPRDAAAKIDRARAQFRAQRKRTAVPLLRLMLRNRLNLIGAGGGGRTHTPRRERDFESEPVGLQ